MTDDNRIEEIRKRWLSPLSADEVWQYWSSGGTSPSDCLKLAEETRQNIAYLLERLEIERKALKAAVRFICVENAFGTGNSDYCREDYWREKTGKDDRDKA